MQWLSIKVAIFRYDKNKDWFSHKTGLVFVYGEVYKGAFKNSATFKMGLFATIRILESCKGLHMMGLQPLVFWNLQNLYLDKHRLDSTKKMLYYTVVKDCMIICTYQ